MIPTPTTPTTNASKSRELLPYVYDDGGRAQYFRGNPKNATDCVCRAVAIASGRDYKQVYDALTAATGQTPRRGVDTRARSFKAFMTSAGFVWTPCSSIGSTASVHYYADELPTAGRLVCSVSGHYTAVIDGVVHDAWDSRYNSFGQPRRIYGYWKFCK